jgi:hypothetical protein
MRLAAQEVVKLPWTRIVVVAPGTAKRVTRSPIGGRFRA